jgi:hypothetical protein
MYERLDKLRADERNEKGKKKRSRNVTKRINLGQTNKSTPYPSVYPCMLDMEWYKDYLDGRPDEKIFTRLEDPEGWAADANDENFDAELDARANY